MTVRCPFHAVTMSKWHLYTFHQVLTRPNDEHLWRLKLPSRRLMLEHTCLKTQIDLLRAPFCDYLGLHWMVVR